MDLIKLSSKGANAGELRINFKFLDTDAICPKI
jgi:hypothetical protein